MFCANWVTTGSFSEHIRLVCRKVMIELCLNYLSSVHFIELNFCISPVSILQFMNLIGCLKILCKPLELQNCYFGHPRWCDNGWTSNVLSGVADIVTTILILDVLHYSSIKDGPKQQIECFMFIHI